MLDDASARSDGRLPLHVITGFLGSGKTALLRGLLDGCTERIAVLVNEVGELGLDHQILEHLDDDVMVLPGGCLCCEVRGELHAALARLRALAPTRIVLETSGLADPAPLLGSIEADPALRAGLRLSGVIAVIDCLRAEELVATQPEVRQQLDFSDRIVLSKSDLAPGRVDAIRAWLEVEAPGREVRLAEFGRIEPEWLLAAPQFVPTPGGDARDWLRRSAHRAEDHLPFTAHTVRSEDPVDVEALQLWLRLVTQLDGDRLLRVKALARCRVTGDGFVLQSAGRAVSPVQCLRSAPPELRGAEVIVIERGMEAAVRSGLLSSLREALAARTHSS